MIKHLGIAAFCIFSLPVLLFSQRYTMHGKVKNAVTGEPVHGVAVKAVLISGYSAFNSPGSVTDVNGAFVISEEWIKLGEEIRLEAIHRDYKASDMKYIIKNNPSPEEYYVFLHPKERAPGISLELLNTYFNQGRFEYLVEIYEDYVDPPQPNDPKFRCALKVKEGIYQLDRCNVPVAKYLFEEAYKICPKGAQYDGARAEIKAYIERASNHSLQKAKAIEYTKKGLYGKSIETYQSLCDPITYSREIELNQRLKAIAETAQSYFNEQDYLRAVDEFFKITMLFDGDEYGIRQIQLCNSKIHFELKKANSYYSEAVSPADFASCYSTYKKYKSWLFVDYLDRKRGCNKVDYDAIISAFKLRFDDARLEEAAWKDELSLALLNLAEMYFSGRGGISAPDCSMDCFVIRGVALFILVKNGGRKGTAEASTFLSRTDTRQKERAKTLLYDCELR